MNYIVERCIPATHPSLPGHFPGNPVVPGVVLLEEILTAISSWRPESRIQGFHTVKFLRPISPGLLFTIALRMPAPERISFVCSTDGVMLNTGMVILELPRESA